VFRIRGVRCGVLVCHEYRYPELVREYKKAGVQLIFHSYHAGNVTPVREAAMRAMIGPDLVRLNGGWSLPEITMPATMQAAAAANHVWLSCPNTSRRQSCFPAFFVRPDGVITGRLRRNRAGILFSTVDTREPFYDSTVAWRGRAMQGRYHSGALVRDPRSRKRTTL
jgi:predicted amidohydrolase